MLVLQNLFSHRSIWKRRPSDPQAVLGYLAMSYLYKRSNRFWPPADQHRLTERFGPLIEHSRRRPLDSGDACRRWSSRQ